MDHIYSVKNIFFEIQLCEIYEKIYYYICIACNYGFNYCPIYYQMIYFYFPLLYLYIRRQRARKNIYYDFEQYESSINYIIIIVSSFMRKVSNATIYLHCIIMIIKKYYFSAKLMFMYKHGARINAIKQSFRINHIWLTWKPVFKKVSYFGIFSYIRSKWYKNK